MPKGLHEVELLGIGNIGLRNPSQIDDRDLFQTERSQVGLDSGPQLVRSLGGQPLPLIVSRRSNFRHQYKVVWIGLKRFTEEFIGNVRPVELGGVDVIHPGVNSVPEYGQGEISVFWRSEHSATGKLHGAEPDAVHAVATK